MVEERGKPSVAWEPPYSEELERACIGAVLVDPVLMVEAMFAAGVAPHTFYSQTYRAIWEAVVELRDIGREVDVQGIAAILDRDAAWLSKTHATSISDALDSIGTAGTFFATDRIDDLMDLWRLRVADDDLQSIRRQIHGRDKLVSITERLSRVADHLLPKSAGAPGDALAAVMNPQGRWYLELPLLGEMSGGTRDNPIHADLGHYIGPLWNGQKIVVGGDTSVGKTSFLTSLTASLCFENVRVGYISLEDSTEEIEGRLASNIAWVPLKWILTNSYPSEDPEARARAEQCLEWLRKHGPVVQYLPGANQRELGLAVRTMVQRHKCQVIVIDYVQAIVTPGHNRVYEISSALGEIKRAASRDTIVIMGSQLSRAATKDGDKPTIHDLRESGTLENDARAIILLSPAGEPVIDQGLNWPVRQPICMDLAKNKLGRKAEVAGTLHLRYSCLWPGTEPPPWSWFRRGEQTPLQEE